MTITRSPSVAASATPAMFDNIAIIGAGALGSFFAARIAETGCSVTAIDVSCERIEAIRRDGIILRDDRGERTIRLACSRPEELTGRFDLMLLLTKAMASDAALASVRHLIDERSYIISLQNGLGTEGAISNIVDEAHSLLGVTDIPADLHKGVTTSSGEGKIWIGALSKDGEDATGRVADLMRAAGLATHREADIRVAIWQKVAFNAALNALATLTNLPAGALDNPSGLFIAFAVVDETVAVAQACGIRIDGDGIKANIARALAQQRDHLPSMLQDRQAGRPTEIEAINGAIERYAGRTAVPAPVNRTLLELIRLTGG